MRARVLLVDDDELVLAVMAEALREAGFDVREAASGEDALTLLGEANCDVIVTDHGMAGMTGQQLLARAASLHPHLPGVLMTGYGEGTVGDCAAEVLRKPFRSQELESLLRRLLAGG